MPSFLRFSHPWGGLLNLDFLVSVQRRQNPEQMELRFVGGTTLIISQEKDAALYKKFARYLQHTVGPFTDIETDTAMQLGSGR